MNHYLLLILAVTGLVCLIYLFVYINIYLFIYKHLGMTVHGEQIIGLEVPYKDLSPMVRAAMSEKKLKNYK